MMMSNETVLLGDYSNMFEKCILVKVETDQSTMSSRLDDGDVADIS